MERDFRRNVNKQEKCYIFPSIREELGEISNRTMELAMADKSTPFGLLADTEERIYRSYAPEIFTYLLRRVPSYQDAEDLLLEVFLAILEKLPTLGNDERQLGAYIQGVARHKMADYYRKRGNTHQVPLDEIIEQTGDDDEASPERLMLAQEKYAHLHHAVNKLPPSYQVILRLHFSHGLRIREIATLLAKNESAVRMSLSRAIKKLRKLYPSEEGGNKE